MFAVLSSLLVVTATSLPLLTHTGLLNVPRTVALFLGIGAGGCQGEGDELHRGAQEEGDGRAGESCHVIATPLPRHSHQKQERIVQSIKLVLPRDATSLTQREMVAVGAGAREPLYDGDAAGTGTGCESRQYSRE